MNILEQLAYELEKAKKEQDILPFFKKNDVLIKNAFSTSWNFSIVIPEFRLGEKYRLDFKAY
jgi:hypothetical protein